MTVDPNLLQAAHRGDRKAQYALYRDCYPVLMAVCVRYRQDKQDAAAAVNQGFLKIIQHLDRYDPKAPFIAWIRRIMINVVIDEFRREKKWRTQTVFPDDTQPEMLPGAMDWNEAEQRLQVEYLETLLRRLPPVTQKVFNLFAIDGFSHQEIAELLQMSEGTSKWHVHQARSRLQGWLADYAKTGEGSG
ncbi:MAG: sigma-70 family RNA polymerase sigma factor [Saprospiraceae bacterium]